LNEIKNQNLFLLQ